MVAMPSVSKNLKKSVRTLLSITPQRLAPSPQTSAGTYRVFVSHDCNVAIKVVMGKTHTLTEWDKGVLRPVTKEPVWHEPVRLLPIPRYKTSSEPVSIIQSHSAYDCSAGPECKSRFPSLTRPEKSSFHRQRCSLSRSYPALRPLRCAVPDHHDVSLASGQNRFN